MATPSKKKGLFVRGQRRRLDLAEFVVAQGARGLKRDQTLAMSNVYNDAVLDPPLSATEVEDVFRDAWTTVKESAKREHFKDLKSVETKAAEFLIYPYVPNGALTILDGNPGMGKSLVTTHLGAMITKGGRFADREKVGRGRVLFMAPEDEADRLLRPRLEAHDADISKVRFMNDPFLLDQPGIELLRQELLSCRPDIVIIDPLSVFIPTETDTYRANQVRGFMRPLATLASQFNLAILVVRHLRKASSDSAIQLGQGSMDFIASVRSGLIVQGHPADPETRVLSQSKANWSRMGPSLKFEVKGYGRDETPTINWLGETELTADQLARGTTKETAEAGAAKLIGELLASGPMRARDAIKILDDRGYSERTIDRAKKIVGVKAGRGPGAEWRCS